MPGTSKLPARLFGAADLASALLVLLGVFAGLPSRWLPVDLGALLVAGALGAAGVGLLRGASWAHHVARIASCVVLALGLLLVAALGLAASWVSGVYGPVGKGGALILVLVVALALPYVVILPSVQLLWLGPRRKEATEQGQVRSAAKDFPSRAERPSPQDEGGRNANADPAS